MAAATGALSIEDGLAARGRRPVARLLSAGTRGGRWLSVGRIGRRLLSVERRADSEKRGTQGAANQQPRSCHWPVHTSLSTSEVERRVDASVMVACAATAAAAGRRSAANDDAVSNTLAHSSRSVQQVRRQQPQ